LYTILLSLIVISILSAIFPSRAASAHAGTRLGIITFLFMAEWASSAKTASFLKKKKKKKKKCAHMRETERILRILIMIARTTQNSCRENISLDRMETVD